ncbi:putative regulatory protein (CxxC_CxxC_SSSS) [uncultured Desulfobacterium sp.]|uniref:Putative regulatory protein (CxxC_CxxC_SSSS) n=1 Tax=uncultured Desulfobacterium sp. TaxID=201089 RepID=A0A445MWV4_9BACT|nr:putative regulatory protein (CxxC_CxxC_SSSS) [uncultured Desulfobacterium sp.]
MPIYEYRCLDCNEDFEALVFGSRDKVTCPRCNGDNLSRLMSSFGFKSGGGSDVTEGYGASSSSSGCASCAGGNCSTCH